MLFSFIQEQEAIKCKWSGHPLDDRMITGAWKTLSMVHTWQVLLLWFSLYQWALHKYCVKHYIYILC